MHAKYNRTFVLKMKFNKNFYDYAIYTCDLLACLWVENSHQI